MPEDRQPAHPWDHLAQELEALGRKIRQVQKHTGQISARLPKLLAHPFATGSDFEINRHNRNLVRGVDRCPHGRRAYGADYLCARTNNCDGKPRQLYTRSSATPLRVTGSPPLEGRNPSSKRPIRNATPPD